MSKVYSWMQEKVVHRLPSSWDCIRLRQKHRVWIAQLRSAKKWAPWKASRPKLAMSYCGGHWLRFPSYVCFGQVCIPNLQYIQLNFEQDHNDISIWYGVYVIYSLTDESRCAIRHGIQLFHTKSLMLQVDPVLRPTASEALQHPFLRTSEQKVCLKPTRR